MREAASVGFRERVSKKEREGENDKIWKSRRRRQRRQHKNEPDCHVGMERENQDERVAHPSLEQCRRKIN